MCLRSSSTSASLLKEHAGSLDFQTICFHFKPCWLANTYFSISFRTSLFDFLFLNSNLIVVNVNLPREDNKTRLAFLSAVLEQQSCYEKPTLKAFLRVLLWRGEGGGCRKDDEDLAEMRGFICTAELHLVILIAYRRFFWMEGMDSVFSWGQCTTLFGMSQKIPLLFSCLHTLPYLYWEDSLFSSVNHSDVARLKVVWEIKDKSKNCHISLKGEKVGQQIGSMAVEKLIWPMGHPFFSGLCRRAGNQVEEFMSCPNYPFPANFYWYFSVLWLEVIVSHDGSGIGTYDILCDGSSLLLYCSRAYNLECEWDVWVFFQLVRREQGLGFFTASVKNCHLPQLKDILIASWSVTYMVGPVAWIQT